MGKTIKNMVKAITANAYKDNGATVVMGGAANTTSSSPSGPAVTQVMLSKIIYGQNARKALGSVVPLATATSGTDAAQAGGYWAKLNQFIIRGGRITTALAGVANTKMGFGMNARVNNYKTCIHSKTTRVTMHITSWNYVTGAATKGSNTTDNFRADDAATPSMAVPGEFAYLIKVSGPTQADYPARTD